MTTEPDLNKEIIQWGRQYLSSHGYILKSDQAENVQNTPWSFVVRFATSEGYIYLKHMPKLLALEATITQILHDQFHATVPEVIAKNEPLTCFLMKDAGKPLRAILKKHFNVALPCKAIDQFTSLQLAIVDHIDIFLDIGAPDWRLDKLPDLYQQLLAQKDVLVADGLSEIEIAELETLAPQVSILCKKLSQHAIKPSLVQCDFHDNNILIDEISQNITLIDLGEIVITHPFFSLIGFLRQTKVHHGLTEKDENYQQLLNACLKNFLTIESKSQLLDAFARAQMLWIIYEALAQYRLRLACDKERFLTYQNLGKLSGRLKEFITLYK